MVPVEPRGKLQLVEQFGLLVDFAGASWLKLLRLVDPTVLATPKHETDLQLIDQAAIIQNLKRGCMAKPSRRMSSKAMDLKK